MKILMSPAMADVFSALGYGGDLFPKKNEMKTFFESFPFILSSKSLFLINKKMAAEANAERHQEVEGFSNLNIALMDIELRENKLRSFLSEGYSSSKNLRTAVVTAFLGSSEVYEKLTKEGNGNDWIVWSSVQPQIGDYEAESDDLKMINLAEVMQSKKAWWYGIDFSFAKYRDKADGFLKELILDSDWGETLSPFHFLLVPDEFKN